MNRVLAAGLMILAAPLAAPAQTQCLAVAASECLQVTVHGEGPDVVLISGLFGSAFAFRHVILRLTAAGGTARVARTAEK